MSPLKIALSASLIVAATSASAFFDGFPLPNLTFPDNRDIVSTQSCETDAKTGVVICGSDD